MLKEGMHNVCVQLTDDEFAALKQIASENSRTVTGQLRFWVKGATKRKATRIRKARELGVEA